MAPTDRPAAVLPIWTRQRLVCDLQKRRFAFCQNGPPHVAWFARWYGEFFYEQPNDCFQRDAVCREMDTLKSAGVR